MITNIHRLNKKIMPITESGCWLWTGATSSNGYGNVWMNGKYRVAHRVIFETLVGEIQEGLELDHLCKVRCCVNPNHLEIVTPQENTLRSDSISSRYAKRTHCHDGHELSGDNLRNERGRRRCATCRRAEGR